MLEKVLEKVKKSNKQHQNGTADVKRPKNGPIGKESKKEAGGVGGSGALGVPGKSVARKDQKRRSFSDSAQFAGLSPEAIYNEAQK